MIGFRFLTYLPLHIVGQAPLYTFTSFSPIGSPKFEEEPKLSYPPVPIAGATLH